MFKFTHFSVKNIIGTLAAITIGLGTLSANAGPREQAIKLHKILTGVMPEEAVIGQMANSIQNGNVPAAAKRAMESPYFWNITLKNLAATWTNENSSPVVSLNDAITTVIGVIANNEPFTQVLKGNFLYVGNNQPAYSGVPADAQAHFEALEASGDSLRTSLTKRTQTVTDAAGIMTSLAWGDAFLKAGTNRRMWRFSMMNFMCTDLEGMMDTTVPGIRIRRDVDRAPGGAPEVFANKCIGCHAIMDAANGATSYFDYTEEDGLIYTPGSVQPKVNRGGQVYPEGYVSTNDSWMFLGNLSANNGLSNLGWRGSTSGNGLNSLATAISESRGFSECMAKQVFKRVCLRTATNADKETIKELADGFEKDGKYNMLDLIASTPQHCMDEE